jgi:hypothetical protein
MLLQLSCKTLFIASITGIAWCIKLISPTNIIWQNNTTPAARNLSS